MKVNSILIVVIFFLWGCKENDDILTYDTTENYVYFALPRSGNNVERFNDSLYYSFAFDEKFGLVEKRLAIPVRIAGNTMPTERPYRFMIEASSRYDDAVITLSEPKIEAHKYVDTLYVNIKRNPSLQQAAMQINLLLLDNDYFKVGHAYNKRIRVRVDDILTQPSWWNMWSREFGPYKREILQKWMEIYYLGADPSPELTGSSPGPFYYWNNMPDLAVPSWYPVTFVYIGVLKQYFIDNVVYPGGDPTKERILLP